MSVCLSVCLCNQDDSLIQRTIVEAQMSGGKRPVDYTGFDCTPSEMSLGGWIIFMSCVSLVWWI